MQKMFDINGFNITGDASQVEKYANDSTEYDYIKDSLEKIRDAARIQAKTENKFVKFFRIKPNLFLTAVKHDEKDDVVLLPYKCSAKTYLDGVNADDMAILRDVSMVERIVDSMKFEQNNMLSEKMIDYTYDLCKKYEQVDSDTEKYEPIPLDDKKHSIQSERGFYIGDPALVLKDEYLNNGIRNKNTKRVIPGMYSIEAESDNGKSRLSMLVMSASNGCHNGHDIHSHAIGVIPLELVDKNKIRMLPPDSLDIRTGNNINIITKGSNMYVAQTKIDVIDTMQIDEAADFEDQSSFQL